MPINNYIYKYIKSDQNLRHVNLSLTPDVTISLGTSKGEEAQGLDVTGTATPHQVTRREPRPGKLPEQRTSSSASVHRCQCRFSCLWHTAYVKLTQETAYHWICIWQRYALNSSAPVVHRTFYLVPNRDFSPTETFSCVCVSSLPEPPAQPSEIWSLFNRFLVLPVYCYCVIYATCAES